jgi:hypothetical protein
LVHRQLDDSPLEASFSEKIWCPEYIAMYKELHNEIIVCLAKDYENICKAFSFLQYGKVLGILFDMRILCWIYPMHGSQKASSQIRDAFMSKEISLVEVQSLIWRLKDEVGSKPTF